jgi:hypothetical protein
MPSTWREARLLFVLSADYGELSNALYFLRGYDFHARLLLPERLFAANRASLPVPAAAYRTTETVLAEIARERPDIVFLFSGYLYAINGVLPLESVVTLVRALRERGIRAVVGDPFLGLLQQPGPSPFSDRHPRKAWLTEHFGALARLFADIPHLYLARPARATATPQLVFYNPRLLLGDADRVAMAELLGRHGVDPAAARWIFVLAGEDHGAQVARMGGERFESLLRERLADAPRAGREALLVAPQPCADRMAASGIEGLRVLSFCGHALFSALLLTAECAFYWNLFSNSATARLANRLPVFYFDAGHMAHAIPPLLDLGLESYFPGWRYELLDLAQPLEPARLARIAAAQERSAAQGHARLRSAPPPDQVVAALLEGH